jgi:hypothetical protein
MQPFSTFRITFWKEDGMSNKRLAAILGGCIAVITAVVIIAAFPPASGEPDDGGVDENSAFHINVIPGQRTEDQDPFYSIAGQHFVFLVTITDEAEECELPVRISATAPGAEVVIYQEDIFEGDVAEVVVIPAQASIGKTIEVTITGNRDSSTDEKVVSFEVAEGEDERQEYAGELLDRFVSWLAANHPELGITDDTAWNGTMVSPVWLVVSHYLFFSDEWEAHISWHIMVPPYDWAKIDLRHRFDELAPSYAFEISSINATSEPVPMEVPEAVWR